MDKETEKKALAALERERKRAAYQNEWAKTQRERVGVLFPLGFKARAAAVGEKSLNAYIIRLVSEDLARREAVAAGSDPTAASVGDLVKRSEYSGEHPAQPSPDPGAGVPADDGAARPGYDDFDDIELPFA